jgi:DNA polymerase III sliding clamp (beta) subunit (PCNA family)
MKLPDKVNPAACVSKDASRYSLNFVRIENGLALATDGRRLFVSQVDSQDDAITEGFVPVAAIKQAIKNRFPKGEFKLSRNEADPNRNDVQVPVNLDACTTYYGPGDIEFPKVYKVIPDQKKPLAITLNAKLLAEIAAGLGDTMVTVTVDVENPGAAMFVTSATQHHAFALLMPGRSGVEWEPVRNITLDMARAARDAQPEPAES